MLKASSRSLTDALGRWERSSQVLSRQLFVILIPRKAGPVEPVAEHRAMRWIAPRDVHLSRRGSALGVRSEN
jgi:hypothetical protein